VLADGPTLGGAMPTLPGATDVLRRIRQSGRRCACFTNGRGQVPAAQASRLRTVGLEVLADELLTPAVVAARSIRAHHAGAGGVAVGNEGLRLPLGAAGARLVEVDGADPAFTSPKRVAACRAVWAGAALLVTSNAAWFASRTGRMPGTSGAIAAGSSHATGEQPVVLGKPSLVVLEVPADLLGAAAEAIVVVGDDLELEIRMGREAAALTVLVLSGATSESQVAAVPPELQPDVVVPAVGALLDWLA
jgi:4-nitrophenyl phosphatase